MSHMTDFEIACDRNIIYTAILPEAGQDVTEDYIQVDGIIPPGFTKILLTHDKNGPALRATGKTVKQENE